MGNIESDEEVDQLARKIDEGLKLHDSSKSLETLAEKIEKGKAKKILILCGAGVSVSAGIPDFRTPGTGLYDNLQKYQLPFPEAIFDLGFYRKKPSAFCTLAQELWPGQKHSPTLTHSFIKLLSKKGLLLRLYSQNIDGLEHIAGIPSEEVVECHGHFRTASCIDCHTEADISKVERTIVDRGETPICSRCDGKVKPDIVFFGESLPARFHKLVKRDARHADMMIILGTSLQVAPVSLIPDMVACPRVLFNREMVMRKKKNDIYVQGDCDASVEKLCGRLGWLEELHEQNKSTRIRGPGKG